MLFRRPFLVLVSIVSVMGLRIPGFAQSVPSAAPPSTKQVIYAPMAGLEEFANSTLVVVNRKLSSVDAAITVYSREGNAFPPTKISLAGEEMRRIAIGNLVPESARALGGLTIAFDSTPMAIGAQITISYFHGFGSIDAAAFPDMMFKSNISDAVWWQPEGGQSFLILGNSGAETIHAAMQFGDGKRKVADIPGHATVVERVVGRPGRIRSVHVVGTGKAGALRVTGYTVAESEGFVSTIRSYDPASRSEYAVYAAGLRFSGGKNHLIVKNLTASPQSVWATIYPLGVDEPPRTRPIAVPTKSLAAGGVGELNLPHDPSLDGAAIAVDGTGPVGFVIAVYIHHDELKRTTQSIPFKDIGDITISTGMDPWQLDAGYGSRVSPDKTRADRSEVVLTTTSSLSTLQPQPSASEHRNAGPLPRKVPMFCDKKEEIYGFIDFFKECEEGGFTIGVSTNISSKIDLITIAISYWDPKESDKLRSIRIPLQVEQSAEFKAEGSIVMTNKIPIPPQNVQAVEITLQNGNHVVDHQKVVYVKHHPHALLLLPGQSRTSCISHQGAAFVASTRDSNWREAIIVHEGQC